MTISFNSLDVDVLFEAKLVLDDAIRAGRTLLSTFFECERLYEASAMSRRRFEDDASAFNGDPCLARSAVVERCGLANWLAVAVEGATGTANSPCATTMSRGL